MKPRTSLLIVAAPYGVALNAEGESATIIRIAIGAARELGGKYKKRGKEKWEKKQEYTLRALMDMN